MKETNYIKTVSDFLNKAAKDIDKKYFPKVKYYGDDPNDQKVHYALECFSNGVLGYRNLIEKLSLLCNDTPAEIHSIVSKHIESFGKYRPRFLNRQYTIPFNLEIVGNYNIRGKNFKTSMFVAGFERNDGEHYLFYPSDKTRNATIGGLIIKNTAIRRLSQGKTVMGKTSVTGETIKIAKL